MPQRKIKQMKSNNSSLNESSDERVNISSSEIAESMANTLSDLKLLPENRIDKFQEDFKNYLNNPNETDSEKYKTMNILFGLASGKFDRPQMIELLGSLKI